MFILCEVVTISHLKWNKEIYEYFCWRKCVYVYNIYQCDWFILVINQWNWLKLVVVGGWYNCWTLHLVYSSVVFLITPLRTNCACHVWLLLLLLRSKNKFDWWSFVLNFIVTQCEFDWAIQINCLKARWLFECSKPWMVFGFDGSHALAYKHYQWLIEKGCYYNQVISNRE